MDVARLRWIEISNYRSLSGPLRVRFPEGFPLVLVGENNAGKSNILRALALLLGQYWPGTHDPEDHEFFGRTRDKAIVIRIGFDEHAPLGGRFTEALWTHDPTLSPATDKSTFHGYPGPWNKPYGFISNDDRDTCMGIFIEAERRLDYQLSYSTKFTLLSRLMHKFHKTLSSQAHTKAALEALFQQVVQRFSEVEPFREFKEQLQTQLGDLLESMTHRLEVDFQAYNPANFFHALRLHAAEGSTPRTIEELGTGEQQILGISFAYAYAKAFHGGVVLLLEEPEAHLHPLAQEWLASRLRQMAADGLQIVLTTHSPHFVDLLGLESLVLVRKPTAEGTEVIQLSIEELLAHSRSMGAPATVTSGNILPFYKAAASPEILEGFFAKLVVLVEGPSEALALPIYLGRLGLETSKSGIAVLPVGGKGSLARWRRLFQAFRISTYMIFDNDSSDDESAVKRRDALASVGIDDEDVQDVFLSLETCHVDASFMVFPLDFERNLRALSPRYAELEDEARSHGVEAKPFLARYVAERFPLDRQDEFWIPFRSFAAALRELL